LNSVKKMVCHNNHAERPFAVLKAFAKMYPSLSLRNLSWLVHSIVNGTHWCAEIFGTKAKSVSVTARFAGIALTAHPDIKSAVNKICSVRRKTVGQVTQLLRASHRVDKNDQVETRKRKAADKFDANVLQQATLAGHRNKAEETAMNSLCTDLEDLEHQLLARQNNKPSRIFFLKEQVYARIAGEKPRLYLGLGAEWRKAGGKIRVSSKNKSQPDEDYLTQLVTAMLREDAANLGVNNSHMPSVTQDYIRALPTISLEYTSRKAVAWKEEFSSEIAKLATPLDDSMLLLLQEKYLGSLLFDNDTRASQKLFRIVAIQFVRSYASNRHSCWEATCEPVYHDTSSGQYLVPKEKQVEGSNLILLNALQGYALAEYQDGMDSDATMLPWVDNYMQHFLAVIEPKCTAQTTQARLASMPVSRPSSRRQSVVPDFKRYK
jgi:hypothetical protein